MTNPAPTMLTTDLPYRIGDMDSTCRHPVFIGSDQVIGWAWRWHRNWLVTSTAGERNLGRPPQGTQGVDMAAAYLVQEHAAGRITVTSLAAEASSHSELFGPVPLLDPRMPETPRNISSARRAFEGLARYRWTALAGFPGSDNPWAVRCDLCGWIGARYWSHLRGRNGSPPSPYRHDECVSADKVRALIPAYHDGPQD